MEASLFFNWQLGQGSKELKAKLQKENNWLLGAKRGAEAGWCFCQTLKISALAGLLHTENSSSHSADGENSAHREGKDVLYIPVGVWASGLPGYQSF